MKRIICDRCGRECPKPEPGRQVPDRLAFLLAAAFDTDLCDLCQKNFADIARRFIGGSIVKVGAGDTETVFGGPTS